MIGKQGVAVFGPPGTGKTTRLLHYLHEQIGAGVPTEAIAFVTFTRAARSEVIDRVTKQFDVTGDELPWFCTVHAAAYRLLGLRPTQVMGARQWTAFGARYGYRLTDASGTSKLDDPPTMPLVSVDDRLRAIDDWSRNRQCGLRQALSETTMAVSAAQAELFVRRRQEFQHENALVDFPGMLEKVLIEKRSPRVLVAFVDEAQDLSPLQVSVVEQWFAPCDSVYIAGDDDQALYGFQGADPSWLITLNQKCGTTEVLGRSHRVPASVHALAARVIGQNLPRVSKRYAPRDEPGLIQVLRPDNILSEVSDERSVFILARNRSYLGPWIRRLRDAVEPFVVEGAAGADPLADPDVRSAVQAAMDLRGRGYLEPAQLRALLKFVPSRGGDLLPYGSKSRADRAWRLVTRTDLQVEWGLEQFLNHLDSVGPVQILSRLSVADRDYLQRLLARYGQLPEPRFRLMTIHGAKGREADVVVVIPDMSRKTYGEYQHGGLVGEETENRVAYVAVTRARRRLILIEPTTRRSYPYEQLLRKAVRPICAIYQPLPNLRRCKHQLGDICALGHEFLCVMPFGHDVRSAPTTSSEHPGSWT